MREMLKKAFVCLLGCVLVFALSACDKSSESGDALTGNKWETTSGMLLDLKKDGTFKWYNDRSNRKDNYYAGNYTIRTGQEAIDYIAETQGFPEESQRSAMVQFSVPDNCYYAIVLNNKERIQGGSNTLEEENEIVYYGYYMPDYQKLQITSLNNLNTYDFTKM